MHKSGGTKLEHSSSIQLLPSPQSPGHRSFLPYYLVPVALGGRWIKTLCVCRTGVSLPLDLWPIDGACTEGVVMRANLHLHCCKLSWGLETRLQDRRQSEDRSWEQTHLDSGFKNLIPSLSVELLIHVLMFIYPFYSASFPETDFFLFQLNFNSITANVNRHKNIHPTEVRTWENWSWISNQRQKIATNI